VVLIGGIMDRRTKCKYCDSDVLNNKCTKCGVVSYQFNDMNGESVADLYEMFVSVVELAHSGELKYAHFCEAIAEMNQLFDEFKKC
jgi:hypothetical protein